MLIECRGISLGNPGSYTTGAVDLTVSAGEVCTIVGSSGSGKTRLCDLLSGTERPVRGVISVDGLNAVDSPVQVSRRVTHVVPEAPLWPGRGAMSNIEYVLRLCGLPRPSDEEAILALRLAEVPDQLFESPTEELSRFHRYGVWLAIHRLRETRILVLDDPFLTLASWQTEALARLIHEAAEGGRCAVITSRSADVPPLAAGRMYRIARGQLMPIETPTSWMADDADTTRLLTRDPVP